MGLHKKDHIRTLLQMPSVGVSYEESPGAANCGGQAHAA